MRIALIGNQNSGKTTLFNLLTGTNQKVGNWPGVTIEKKSGLMRQSQHELIDLPGIYGLSPYSFEEDISRRFLLTEDIDLIINIVDATSLERSLYLTTQLSELGIPMVLALNMSDLIHRRGITIDIPTLESQLSIPIIPISALKKTGIMELITRINKNQFHAVTLKPFDDVIEKAISDIEDTLDGMHKRFRAVKYIEEDITFLENMSETTHHIVDTLKKTYPKDLEQTIADQRYRYITTLRDQAIFVCEQNKTTTDKIDDILLNKYLAIPIFVVIMFLIYYVAAGPIGQWSIGII
ncbi:MAG: FeoB small GTPase domain-containing protein, partial [Acholeplasmataceae bacterium]